MKGMTPEQPTFRTFAICLWLAIIAFGVWRMVSIGEKMIEVYCTKNNLINCEV